MGDGDADRTSPDLIVVDHKASDKILVLTGRHAVLQADANDLVTGPLQAIPRAVLGGESVAAIFFGKIASLVERQSKRCRMRLKQNIRYCDLVFQIRTFASMPGVLMAANIIPWPSIKCVLANAGHIVGHQIVAEAIALVGRAPGRSALRLNCETDAIADAGGEQFPVLAVGIEGQYRRAVGLVAPRGAERQLAAPCLQPVGGPAHALAVIAGRPDRNQHPLVVRREDDVAGRMPRS